ncbi:MAG TPA: hypothetical protein VGM37_04425 [Armatimonadota bacterium]|jgi:hypothetical protein
MSAGAQHGGGLFGTGRVVTLAVLLLVGGIALTPMNDGTMARWWSGLSGAVDRAPGANRLVGMEQSAKVVATKSRLRGIRQELKLWAHRHGPPDADDLTQAVGRDTATDAWGHRIRLQPPTSDREGWLVSYGPDGAPSKDDVFISVSWQDVQ